MVFTNSTQACKWMSTREELREKRCKANSKCKEQLKKYDQELDLAMCISEIEEGKIVDSFLNMIKPFYRKFSPTLPTQVYGISVTYFRRFFLKHSVMDFHPREIILACIYVACKAAEFNISIDSFLKNIPKNSEKYHSFIYNSELFLIDELDYDLWIYTPYEPFQAFMVELKAFHIETILLNVKSELRMNDRIKMIADNEQLNSLIKGGINIINEWYETDLMMLFSPDHVALAATEAITDLDKTVFREFVLRKIANSNESTFTNLITILEEIKSFVHYELIVVGIEKLKVYEQKIDVYRNPKYNMQSDVYQQYKEQFDAKYNTFD